jgi:hypothetical protein
MNPTTTSYGWFKTFLITLFLGFIVSPVFALFDMGGILGVGTRAMGLSGAFVAIADDPSAAYWNPAGLVQLDKPEILAMYGSYLNDKDRNLYFSFHYPLPDDIHLSISTNNLFYTDISGAHEDQYEGSVAIPMDNIVKEKRLMLGASFKYLLADEGNGSGIIQGTGVDLGVLFRQPFKDDTEIKAGLVLTDISTSVRYDNTGVEQPIPSILTLGLAYKFDPYTLISTDVPWTLDNDTLLGGEDINVRGGMEHWFLDGRLGLRAGFISFQTLSAEFSVGASYKMPDWSIDYAFSNHPVLGNNHRLSASYVFDSGAPGKAEPKPYMVQSFVGDEKIYLKWDIPPGSQTDGYLVYIRTDEEKDFHRAKQELLQTKYCLLRGAKNGARYHIIIRSVVGGQEKYSCNEWLAVPQPMSEDARKYYDEGMSYFNQNNLTSALYVTRKAEELDPNNYDIKDLIRKLETSHHEGLVPEESTNDIQK